MKNIIFALMLLFGEIALYVGIGELFNIPPNFLVKTLIIYILLMAGNNHYVRNTRLIWEEIYINSKVMIFHALLCVIIGTNKVENVDFVEMIILSCSMFVISVVFSRFIRIVGRKCFAYNTLVIGDGWVVNRYLDIAKNNRFSLINVSGVVSILGSKEKELKMESDIKAYEFTELENALRTPNIDQIVILLRDENSRYNEEVMKLINNKVLRVQTLVNGGGFVTFASQIQDFDGLLLCTNSITKIGIGTRIIKRLVDIVASIIGCLLCIPLYIKVRKDYRIAGDMAPVIFKQERIGREGKPIQIYKFRTMIDNAEQVLEELMEKDSDIREEYLTNKKLENDPRVTKLGEKLRRSSLDEFPQFINVLKGEMSLVGPRPYLYREKEDMGIYYNSIIECKPGITGMWQANGRSDVGFEERCRYDDYYYKNWSIMMEFIIIYKTIKGVVYGKGAM